MDPFLARGYLCPAGPTSERRPVDFSTSASAWAVTSSKSITRERRVAQSIRVSVRRERSGNPFSYIPGDRLGLRRHLSIVGRPSRKIRNGQCSAVGESGGSCAELDLMGDRLRCGS